MILEVCLFEIVWELDDERSSVMLVELFRVVPLLDKGHHRPELLEIEIFLVAIHENVIDFEECHVVN